MSAFTPEQITALQSNNIQFGWITHGMTASQHFHNLSYKHGPAILGVCDSDYAVVESLIGKVNPDGVFAREASGGEPVTPVRSVIDELQSFLYQSPYADKDLRTALLDTGEPFLALDVSVQNNPAAIHESPDLKRALVGALTEARKLWLINPLEYGDGLATARGLRRIIADSPRKAFMDRSRVRDVAVGDQDMALALGAEAIRMSASGNTGSTLLHVAGSGHKPGLENIFNEAGIPFNSETAGVPLAYRLADKVSLYGIVLFNRDPSKSWVQLQVNRWKRNIRRNGHTLIDPQKMN